VRKIISWFELKNLQEGKMSIEDNLKVIKNAELDIELLRRKNEKLCEVNNKEVDNFIAVIKDAEEMLEINLKESGKDKLECKIGYCSYRKMPDSWIYDEKELALWLNSLPQDMSSKYIKITTSIKKADLKKEISEHNPDSFTDGKMTQTFLDSDIVGHEMFINYIENLTAKVTSVHGIKVEHQDSKFSYKIKR
jgi:hypothetical protein